MKTHLSFVVASSPGQYQAAHKLIRSEGIEQKQPLCFPTIMAWDGDELVGICGTRVINKMILAGPLVMKSDTKRLFTIMRLCEAYEIAMEQVGISSFIIEAEQGSILQRAFERYFPDLKPYASQDGSDYYVWKVKGYGNQSKRAGSVGRGEGATEEPGRTAGPAAPDNRGATNPEPNYPPIPGTAGGL